METLIFTILTISSIISTACIFTAFSAYRRSKDLKIKLERTDEHLHDLIEELSNKNKESFDWYLALMGYNRIDLNDREGLILAEDLKGNKFIAERFTSPMVFVPAKEKKLKNGTRTVEYNGKVLEFELEEAKQF